MRNIEIISFINLNKVKDYVSFLSYNLNKNEKTLKLFNYLNKNWLSKNYEIFNYRKLIDYKDNENDEGKKLANYIYFTNNIAESLHSRINFYLPKQITKPNTFIEAFKKVFINNELKHNAVNTYDYNSKTIIEIIDKENLNEKFKWITLEIYFKHHERLNNNDIKELIEIINDIDAEATIYIMKII